MPRLRAMAAPARPQPAAPASVMAAPPVPTAAKAAAPSDQEEGFMSQMDSVDRAAIPFSGGSPYAWREARKGQLRRAGGKKAYPAEVLVMGARPSKPQAKSQYDRLEGVAA